MKKSWAALLCVVYLTSTCLVDSNGMLSETGWEKLLPVCDGAMLDLKAWGSECHQQLTGRDNQQIKHRGDFRIVDKGQVR